MLEQRNKHLQNVITRFGNYDNIEFDFASSAGKNKARGGASNFIEMNENENEDESLDFSDTPAEESKVPVDNPTQEIE